MFDFGISAILKLGFYYKILSIESFYSSIIGYWYDCVDDKELIYNRTRVSSICLKTIKLSVIALFKYSLSLWDCK